MSTRLDDVDLSATMSKEDSLARLLTAQRRLTHLRLYAAGLLDLPTPGPAIVVVVEGFDAAGKGGAIRRIAAALDPRHVRVVPVDTPTPVEAAHHFLWRFQADLPGRGEMTIFDRSWYGRLLVERVEGLISPRTLTRSVHEIVEFERALTHDGTIIVKFFLHVSADEQLRRFTERQNDPLKHWKLTADDWRNRERREAYVEAVDDVLATTDVPHARWHVVPAESKHYARVHVLESLNTALEHGLSGLGYEVPPSRGDDYLDRS